MNLSKTPGCASRREEEIYVDTNYQILYEDDFFMAVDKPAPLPVHATGRFKEKNLLSLLQKTGRWRNAKLAIVNRLDSETSGVVLIAKTSEVAGHLGRQFEDRAVEKEYRAIVFGVPEKKEDVIRFPLGFKIENRNRRRVHDPEGQNAETYYEVISERQKYSLLRIIPMTGRTHQIRAHLALSGHPVVGDKIYIDNLLFDRYVREGWQEDMRPVLKMPRLALHAIRLKINHPADLKPMEFSSELPTVFQKFLDRKGNS